MAIKVLPSSEVRDHMAAVIKALSENGDSCFITQYGKAEAVMLSVERFNQLMSLVEDTLDENDELLALRVKESQHNYRKGKGIKVDL